MPRFTRAAIAAVLAAVAAPAAADAATIETGNKTQDTVIYRAAAGEINDLRVTSPGKGVVISDSAPIKLADDDCRLLATGDALCLNGQRVFIELGDGNDRIEHVSPVSGKIDAGSGNDLFIAGRRELTRPSQGLINYVGGAGQSDKISYASTNRAVNVSLGDDVDDGRAGENENVHDDVEIVEGSPFDDTITGSNLDKFERFIGGDGNDTIAGLGGDDLFDEGARANGSDTYNGGAGIDRVNYGLRTEGVNVDLDLARNDGEPGELDFLDPNVNDVTTGRGADVITGSAGPNAINANGGTDTIVALGGNDRLFGGTAVDHLFAGEGDDVVETVDNTPDEIRCDVGADTLNRDLQDVDATGCETVNSVGTLALAAKGSTVRLSWSHPQSWQQLRKVELKLRLRKRIVGRIAIRPHVDTIGDSGAVHVERARLSHRGKKVTARLKLRYDRALAGEVLRADVVAVDRRGVRQLERDAGTVRVAR